MKKHFKLKPSGLIIFERSLDITFFLRVINSGSIDYGAPQVLTLRFEVSCSF